MIEDSSFGIELELRLTYHSEVFEAWNLNRERMLPPEESTPTYRS